MARRRSRLRRWWRRARRLKARAVRLHRAMRRVRQKLWPKRTQAQQRAARARRARRRRVNREHRAAWRELRRRSRLTPVERVRTAAEWVAVGGVLVAAPLSLGMGGSWWLGVGAGAAVAGAGAAYAAQRYYGADAPEVDRAASQVARAVDKREPPPRRRAPLCEAELARVDQLAVDALRGDPVLGLTSDRADRVEPIDLDELQRLIAAKQSHLRRQEGDTAMSSPTGEFTNLPALRTKYDQIKQAALQIQEQAAHNAAHETDEAARLEAEASQLSQAAAAWQSIAAQLAANEHDGNTVANAAAMAERLSVLASATKRDAEGCAIEAENSQRQAAAAEAVAATAENGSRDIAQLSALMELAQALGANAKLRQYAGG